MKNRSFAVRRLALLEALEDAEQGVSADSQLSSGMRRNLRCIQALKPVEAPAEMARPEFLESIYERALASDQLGRLLQDALPPTAAPETLVFEQGVWADRLVEAQPDVSRPLGSLSRKPAPGWLWSRIQADIRGQIAQKRNLARWPRTVAAAAMVLVLGGGVFLGLKVLNPINAGTSGDPEIVIQQVSEPLGSSFHPVRLVRDLAEAR